jgi:cobalt-zinc-cadmium efflux system membrane fusion protein
MHPRIKSLLPRVSSWALAALALAALIGLACWAAAHDWKAPRFADLGRAPGGGEKKKASEKEEEAPTPTSDDPKALPEVKLKSPEAAGQAGIDCAKVGERSMARYVTAHGVLAFNEHRHVRLSTRAFGTAWSVERHEGESVKKGDVLGIVAAGEVGKAKADLLQALVQYQVRSKNLERVQAAADSMPERELRAAKAAAREAQVSLLAAHQALLNLGLEITLEELLGLPDDQAVRKLRLLGLPEEVVRRVNPATLTANLLPLTSPLDGLVIDHNMAIGEVLDPVRTQHQFIVADVRTLWLMLDVRLEDVGRLALGQEVTFRPDADRRAGPARPVARALTAQGLVVPGAAAAGCAPAVVASRVARLPVEATGKLTWISAEVDAKTRTVRARADIDNPDGRLRPAMFGEVTVLVERKPQAVAVPDQAVQFDGRRNVPEHQAQPLERAGYQGTVQPDGRHHVQAHLVFVRESDEVFRPRVVRRGVSAGGYTEILSGVQPGELVATVGSHALKSEMLKHLIGGEE